MVCRFRRDGGVRSSLGSGPASLAGRFIALVIRMRAAGPPIALGMRLVSHWDQKLSQFGDRPGLDDGNVTIELTVPVRGTKTVTVESEDLEVAAEGGSVIGLFIDLSQGKHLFIPWGNVACMHDAQES